MSNVLPPDPIATSDAAAVHSSETAPLPTGAGERDLPSHRDLLSRQEAIVAVGRRAIAAPDLPILMQDAASLIADMLHAEHYCVAELAPDGSKITHMLTLREPQAAKPQVFVGESGVAETDSLAGFALAVGHPVVVDALSEDTRFSDRFLNTHGISSAASAPLRLKQQSFGALLACNSHPQPFDPEDVSFVETVAHLITTTIGRIHVEKALAAERRLSAEVFQAVGALVLVLNEQGRIVRVNRACEKTTGFSFEEIADWPIWDVFVVPGEADLLQTIVKKLHEGISPVERESRLLTKHCEERQIRWSFAAVPGPGGSIESIVATGIDVTDQRQAEERADRAEQVAELAWSDINWASSASPDSDENGSASSHKEPATPPQEDLAALGLPGPINRDRRRRQRLAYPYRQFIAPIIGGNLPAEDEFIEIQCNDIAPGGFSFLSPKPPQSEVLVVGLGTPPKLTYLTAQVVHITRTERHGRRVYLVGCSYVGRVAY